MKRILLIIFIIMIFILSGCSEENTLEKNLNETLESTTSTLETTTTTIVTTTTTSSTTTTTMSFEDCFEKITVDKNKIISLNEKEATTRIQKKSGNLYLDYNQQFNEQPYSLSLPIVFNNYTIKFDDTFIIIKNYSLYKNENRFEYIESVDLYLTKEKKCIEEINDYYLHVGYHDYSLPIGKTNQEGKIKVSYYSNIDTRLKSIDVRINKGDYLFNEGFNNRSISRNFYNYFTIPIGGLKPGEYEVEVKLTEENGNVIFEKRQIEILDKNKFIVQPYEFGNIQIQNIYNNKIEVRYNYLTKTFNLSLGECNLVLDEFNNEVELCYNRNINNIYFIFEIKGLKTDEFDFYKDKCKTTYNIEIGEKINIPKLGEYTLRKITSNPNIVIFERKGEFPWYLYLSYDNKEEKVSNLIVESVSKNGLKLNYYDQYCYD